MIPVKMYGQQIKVLSSNPRRSKEEIESEPITESRLFSDRLSRGLIILGAGWFLGLICAQMIAR